MPIYYVRKNLNRWHAAYVRTTSKDKLDIFLALEGYDYVLPVSPAHEQFILNKEIAVLGLDEEGK